MLYLNEFANDTQRKKAMKATTIETLLAGLKENLGEDNVVLVPKKTTICDEDGNETDIAGNTILAAVGLVKDVDGFEREAIVEIKCVAKDWVNKTDRNGCTKITYTLDDVREAMEEVE